MAAPSRYDPRKFRELLLYIADRLRDDEFGGSVKLNKLLYLTECAAVIELGQPIAAARYQKNRHGTTARALPPVQTELIEAGHAEIRTERTPFGKMQNRLVALRAPDIQLFTSTEIAVIDNVVDEHYGLSGTQLEEMTHQRIEWHLVEDGDDIPLEAAYLEPEPQNLPEWAREKARALANELSNQSG